MFETSQNSVAHPTHSLALPMHGLAIARYAPTIARMPQPCPIMLLGSV